MDNDEYCRDVESHLCRKNDGHLIRIAGPSFELVCGWAKQGIPLNVVRRGIDRCFERYYARGPRRHPVRIDFCEADILDTFDDWRRAVGIFLHRTTPDLAPEDVPAGLDIVPKPKSVRRSLAEHIDRVVGRLVARRTDADMLELKREVLRAIELLDAMRDKATKVRGAARARLIEELSGVDDALSSAMRQSSSAALREELTREARMELDPFRQRMSAEVFQHAVEAAAARLLRDRLGLPTISYE